MTTPTRAVRGVGILVLLQFYVSLSRHSILLTVRLVVTMLTSLLTRRPIGAVFSRQLAPRLREALVVTVV